MTAASTARVRRSVADILHWMRSSDGDRVSEALDDLLVGWDHPQTLRTAARQLSAANAAMVRGLAGFPDEHMPLAVHLVDWHGEPISVDSMAPVARATARSVFAAANGDLGAAEEQVALVEANTGAGGLAEMFTHLLMWSADLMASCEHTQVEVPPWLAASWS